MFTASRPITLIMTTMENERNKTNSHNPKLNSLFNTTYKSKPHLSDEHRKKMTTQDVKPLKPAADLQRESSSLTSAHKPQRNDFFARLEAQRTAELEALLPPPKPLVAPNSLEIVSISGAANDSSDGEDESIHPVSRSVAKPAANMSIELHRPNSPTWKNGVVDIQSARQHQPPPAPPPPTTTSSTSTSNAHFSFSSSPPFAPSVVLSEVQELLSAIPSESDELDKMRETIKDFQPPSELKVKLMKHQILGVSWMLDREATTGGGILADDMGLGKTVQTLALILANRSKEFSCRTTLIVAPLALIKQWESEINTKTSKNSLKVHIHHGSNRTKDARKLNQYDVVITTYQVVASEWPKAEKKKVVKAISTSKPADLSDNDDDYSSDLDSLDESDVKKPPKAKRGRGALFNTPFWRIVLDEAQTIKNKATRGAIGCSMLSAKKRWCLTGTPIQNNVDELYSLFKFLKVKTFEDYTTFKNMIVKPMSQGNTRVALKRLQAILKLLMLRRTKLTMLDGKPLLELPERKVNTNITEFSAEERAFYIALEDRTKNTFKKFMKAGGVQNNYMSILLLLLRLRQACNHPFLVQRSLDLDISDVVVNVRKAEDNDEDDQTAKELSKMMSGMALGSSSSQTSAKCQICLEELHTGEKTHCDSCRVRFAMNIPLTPTKITGVDGEAERVPDAMSFDFQTSTKIERMLEILEETKNGDGGKTIIFSQFTSMLDLVEEPLRNAKYNFVRYDGSMNNKLREESLDKLRNNPRVRVLLISLKCGSLGLNLTCANHVILLDVWWNPAVEDQAIDRLHRIGQSETVYVEKLTIMSTVEDRIMKLQDQKRETAQGVLGEGSAGLKLGKLSNDELMYLFQSESDDVRGRNKYIGWRG